MAGALILDLRWGAKRASSGRHVAGAAVSSVAWFSMGIAFAVFLWCFHDVDTALTFLTGYFVEKSLSVDNLIVIALIFKSFRIKPVFQAPVLKWGIIGAVVFRTIFIFAGITLLEYFHSAFYIFGALLLWSAYKMFFDEDDDGDFESHKKGDSWMMRLLTLFIPYSAEAHCSKFVVKINGRWHATPMLAALVVVELSDLIFAVDSIPCILGLTQDLLRLRRVRPSSCSNAWSFGFCSGPLKLNFKDDCHLLTLHVTRKAWECFSKLTLRIYVCTRYPTCSWR